MMMLEIRQARLLIWALPAADFHKAYLHYDCSRRTLAFQASSVATKRNLDQLRYDTVCPTVFPPTLKINNSFNRPDTFVFFSRSF